MAEATTPEGITADYDNLDVREALLALQTTPDYERLASFLRSLREGLLVADVTGTHKKKSTRVRTIRSTKGQLLLPLFTSMHELRLAHPKAAAQEAKGAIMPSREALALMRTGPFVAVQLNAGSVAQVVLRRYIDLVLSEQTIDAQALEAQR